MTVSLLRRTAAVGVLLLTGSCIFASDAKTTSGNWQSELLAWRADYTKQLQKPDGWLTLVGLEWLKPGDNSFGAAPDNSLPLKTQTVSHIGVVQLSGQNLDLQPPKEGFPKGLMVDGKAPASSQKLISDDSGHPSKITLGTLTIVVIHRGDRYALRVKDSQAASRTQFHGLKWYEPNPSYRVQAKWVPYSPPKREKIPTILGTEVESTVPGAAEFTLEGKTLRLEPIIESPDSKELFFIVRDSTSKTKTYGAGRFLYTELPDHGLSQPGQLWLDFNRLENPPCAYTPYATCPLPPPQNRLQVGLPAGEQRYHD
jgi:hypothetical protein